MLARFRVLLPYTFSVPYRDYAAMRPHEFRYDEYRVRAYPPLAANVDPSVEDVTSPIPLMDAIVDLEEKALVAPITAIKINGQESVQANLLQLDLLAARDFRRLRHQKQEPDPPLDVLFKLANSLLARIRAAGRLANVRPVDLDSSAGWKLEYLTDNGEKLPKDESLFRACSSSSTSWRISAMPAGVWDVARALPDDFSPPIWDTLLLDANAQLPDVNTSIVLANAALESLIRFSLDVLAEGSSIPPESWKWLSARNDDWLKQPSVKEMFDQALYLLTRRSLKKEQPELWKAFDELRDARNSMVHRGKAVVKRKSKKDSPEGEVTPQKARELVDGAGRIIRWVESLLPAEHRRVMFEGTVNFALERSATGPEPRESQTELVGIRGDLNRINVSIGDKKLQFAEEGTRTGKAGKSNR